ncbi:MAG: stage II sporulation protein M [Firmicutes bacterium]|nr:stage II sporulation protein M [Bacillota bacterium]
MPGNVVVGEIKKIKHYYREALTCFAIFVLAAYGGYLAAVILGAGQAEHYLAAIKSAVIGREMPDNVFLFILARNATVSILVLALGIFTRNIWPVVVLIFNGALSGFFVQLQSLLFHRFSFEIWLFGLLPHGVPELGALFLAAGASFYYGRLRKTGRFTWSGVIGTYLVVILPLLVLAALIETFVTPALIHRFLA